MILSYLVLLLSLELEDLPADTFVFLRKCSYDNGPILPCPPFLYQNKTWPLGFPSNLRWPNWTTRGTRKVTCVRYYNCLHHRVFSFVLLLHRQPVIPVLSFFPFHKPGRLEGLARPTRSPQITSGVTPSRCVWDAWWCDILDYIFFPLQGCR